MKLTEFAIKAGSFLLAMSQKKKGQMTVSIPIDVPKPSQVEEHHEIDWNNLDDKVSKYFTVKECIWLPSWKRAATEMDGLNDTTKASLIKLCKQLDQVRDLFDKPIRTHVAYRPTEYNKEIHGAANSAHIYGEAMDFDVIGMTCDEVRKQLVDQNKLEELGLRCEDTPGTGWVHLDIRAVEPGGHRFFKP